MKKALYQVTLMVEVEDDGTDRSALVDEILTAIVDSGAREYKELEILDSHSYSVQLVRRTS